MNQMYASLGRVLAAFVTACGVVALAADVLPPTVTLISNQSPKQEDTGIGPLAFTIGDPDTAIGALILVPATSSNVAVVSGAGLIYGGSGAARTLTVQPVANAVGTTTITYGVSDGVRSTTKSFTVTFTAVNDKPYFSAPLANTLTISEGSTTGALSFSFWDVDSPGSAMILLAASSSNQALVPNSSITYSGPQTWVKFLTATPAADAFGTTVITYGVSDGLLTATKSFTLTVNNINDAPSFVKGVNRTTLEDAGLQTVAGWATSISAGPNETGQTVSFTTMSVGNPALFSVQPSVSPTGILTYQSAPDAFGSSTVAIRIQDDGGTTTGGINVSANQQFTLTVTSVNDRPSFSVYAPYAPFVNEDVGAVTVANWAQSIKAGPANESAQTLVFSASATNAALFAVQPAISPTGTLTYTPAANAWGTSTVLVTATDSGGTASGGVNTSATHSFIITVNGINDAPSFVKGVNRTTLED
ncbi:MAG: hypothetical protein RLZZ127_2292, partial [Planctomycetota bacterium]